MHKERPVVLVAGGPRSSFEEFAPVLDREELLETWPERHEIAFDTPEQWRARAREALAAAIGMALLFRSMGYLTHKSVARLLAADGFLFCLIFIAVEPSTTPRRPWQTVTSWTWTPC